MIAAYSPLDEMRCLLIRQRILQSKYGITNAQVYNIEYYLGERERDLKMNKISMNEDIKEFPIYALAKSGRLVEIDWIKSTDDYNHYYYNLHHYIKKEHYRQNKQWYEKRGIKQKLILLPIFIHEQLHNQAIKILSNEDFFVRFKIKKSDLLFSRKTSNY